MYLLKSLRKRRKISTEQSGLGMLQNRKIVLTGDFFPLDKETFEAKLNRLKGDVQQEMSSETDVLICGKFPDWNLVINAEKNGIYTIFVDKVSDIFSLSRWRSESIFHEQ